MKLHLVELNISDQSCYLNSTLNNTASIKPISKKMQSRGQKQLCWREKWAILVLTSALFCQPQLAIAGSQNSLDQQTTTEDSLSHVAHIEINLTNRELILYHGPIQVKRYPVAVGREEWPTPTGDFHVMQMTHDPAWMNPFTSEVIEGGDENNPLGRHWIGFWTDGVNWIGMHGTPNPETVGTQASHGCIRLYNHDIEELFSLVNLGTPVIVVP
jgi:L,D-transpeptidase catalytic domain